MDTVFGVILIWIAAIYDTSTAQWKCLMKTFGKKDSDELEVSLNDILVRLPVPSVTGTSDIDIKICFRENRGCFWGIVCFKTASDINIRMKYKG